MENKKGFVIDAFESINLPYDELLLFRKSKPLGKDGLIIIKRFTTVVTRECLHKDFINAFNSTLNPDNKEEIHKLSSNKINPIFGLSIFNRPNGLALGSLQLKQGEAIILEVHSDSRTEPYDDAPVKLGIYKILDVMKSQIYDDLTFSEFKSLVNIAPIMYNWFNSKKANKMSKNVYVPKKKKMYND